MYNNAIKYAVAGVCAIAVLWSGLRLFPPQTDTAVVCSIPGVGSTVMHVHNIKAEPYGFSGQDESGRWQFYMKSVVEACWSTDEELFQRNMNGSKAPQNPVQRDDDGISVLEFHQGRSSE